MTVLQHLELSGEEHSGLVDRCASLTAANIERFKNSYPDFGMVDEDGKTRYPNENRYPPGLLDCTKGAHELIGERIIRPIFKEAEELASKLKPRVLVYCNDVPKEEIARSMPGCELDFAFDDKEAVEKMRGTQYDGIVLGFWETKSKALGNDKNIHVLYLETDNRDHYIIGEHQPNCRKALLALPNFQVEYLEKFVFNFMIDKPLKRDPKLYGRFISDRIRDEITGFENKVRDILRELDPVELQYFARLLCTYGVEERQKPEPEQPKHTVDGGKLLQSIRRKTARYSVSTETP
jgi:hypothetical protein